MEEEIIKAAANLANPNVCKTDNWIEGAKWQAERMYSEEEVLKLLVNFSNDRTFLKKDVVIRWFEQFKKK
jgi:hypothetical protein